jgi:hypothetical protein
MALPQRGAMHSDSLVDFFLWGGRANLIGLGIKP